MASATGAALAAALLLAGCAPRGELAWDPAAASVGTVETVFVGTSRGPAPWPLLYGSERATTPAFARFDVSVPPERAPGTIEFARGGRVDPSRQFAVTAADRLRGAEGLTAALDRDLAGRPERERYVGLFVHGFNTNFAEALYRQAQLQHDLGFAATSLQFSWPSAAKSDRYPYDRESALFSRDALARTIRAAAASRAVKVDLIGHSMGAFLLMETLRDMARDDAATFGRIGTVLLLSPDIDVEVFRRQAEPVLATGVQIFVAVSRGDGALRLSAGLHQDADRLGSIRSVSELGGLDVAVIDLSDVKGGGGLGHFKEATSPALIAFIDGLNARGQGLIGEGAPASLGETGAALIQKGAQIVAAPLSGI